MNALKATGCLIYLSATPSDALLKETTNFAVEKMPLRFHQRPLIVPQLIWYEGWRNVYQTKRRLRRLLFHLQRLSQTNFVLVFAQVLFYGTARKSCSIILKRGDDNQCFSKRPCSNRKSSQGAQFKVSDSFHNYHLGTRCYL